MDELLQQHEAEHYHCPGFWQKVTEEFPLHSQSEVHSGLLTTRRVREQWKTDLYSLTSEYFIVYQVHCKQHESKANPLKYSPIRWKRVEAFTEEQEEAPAMRYGFRVARGSNVHDFYVASSSELEAWLDALNQVAVMTDFPNDFAIEKEIGSGNYAVVYVGRQLTSNRQVAIKSLLKSALVTSPRTISALITEVHIMKKLKHRRVLRLLGIYEDDEKLYLILEHAGGGDLFHRLLAKGRFSEAKAAEFMRELLDAIAYMHRNGIVHRDLKPENILLMSTSSEVDFKIADFGLAAECDVGNELSQRCGSPGYVAPEILSKQVYSTKVDVFSAGVILYIL
jgi:hypothetical protein